MKIKEVVRDRMSCKQVMSAIVVLSALCLSVDADPPPTPTFTEVAVDANGVTTARAIADINGDACPDVFGLNENELFCYLSPDWTRVSLVVPTVGEHGYAFFRCDELAAGDIDNDGDADAVVRIGDSGDVNGNTVWFANPGDGIESGAVWSMHTIGGNEYAKNIAVADVDRDGKLDVITREHTRTQIWFQNSADSWTRKQIEHPEHEGMAIGDLDDDGDPDIILNGFWLRTPSAPRSGNYTQANIDSTWYTGQTGGQVWQLHNCKVAVGDIDGDYALDVLLSHSELLGYPVVWYSAADPVNGPWVAHEITPQCDYCHNLSAGDFNNDGLTDVLLGGMPQSQHRGLKLFLGDGGQGWSSSVVQSAGSYSVVIGDLQLDGDLDIAGVRAWDEGPTEWWLNDLHDPSAVADVDGNGVVDLTDLSIILANFGRTRVGYSGGDVNGDEVVDLTDLAQVLATFEQVRCVPIPLPRATTLDATDAPAHG